jgi:predicted transcriptional regulator
VIEKKLKAKQKKFPQTTYAKDKTKYVVKEWGLADDSANVLVFDKDGKLLYQHVGKMSKEEIEKVLDLIQKTL